MATDLRTKRSSNDPDYYDEESAAVADVPEEVCQYLQYFRRMLEDENVPEILGLYEQGFPEITERFFSEKPWPEASIVDRIVGPASNLVTPTETSAANPFADNHLFLILYKELYYRDLYTRAQRGPSLQYRFGSFMNYQDLFSVILYQPATPVRAQLPNLWLWDVIDEFVYQFQAFCLYKTNPLKRTSEDSEDLLDIEEASSAWSIYPVLNILYSLVQKSQINEQLKAIREGQNPDNVADEFGRSAFYFKLGYFSLIGLLRTHVLLGDYHQALQTVENLEFDPKGLYNTVPSCLVTLHYFVGFSHMMMRNYGEATKIFVNCLLYIQRTQNLNHLVQPMSQQKKSGGKYDVIGKTNEQLFHLLSICLTLQPQRIDESIQSQLFERIGDRMQRMSNGDMDEFRNAFLLGSPKFLSPTTIVLEGSNMSKEPQLRQCQVFLEGIESQLCLPILRGYLKLYTSLPMTKLAGFMDVKSEDFESFIGKLLTFKMIVNELGKETVDRSDLDDTNTDLDFYVDKKMIIIADLKVARRIGEYFIKHIGKLQAVLSSIESIGSHQ
ncbi:Eukaryotic translation initiation factor 3 subunit L [Aphelenchoides besseyi]|nr:Eukaryotic translation initiation factor 3 subunit L [Aphelenchoides besseyi]KAI6194965.1 Eukaryotic translation initiation factor 3 subunit L [Aphelenchoides besseyi]